MTLATILLTVLGVVIPPPMCSVLAWAAQRHDVPVSILAAVGWHESHLGLILRAASPFGVRIHHVYIHDVAVSADIAGRSLARLEDQCGGWQRACVAYRYGRGCGAVDTTGYCGRVLALAARITRAGVP